MVKLTKEQIVSSIQGSILKTTGYSMSKKHIKLVLNGWKDIATQALVEGKGVHMVDVGILKPSIIKGRTYISPMIKSGEVTKEDHPTVRFKLSKTLRDKL